MDSLKVGWHKARLVGEALSIRSVNSDFLSNLFINRTLHGNNVEPKNGVPPHLARAEPISESRVLVSDGKAPLLSLHFASDSRLTVIALCLPPHVQKSFV